mgnify:CR=1 FL=1|tara:strand:- start:23993 stop:25759 length:1767 start_codon:yes stop_codon:yes gene_type:complete
MRNWKLWIWPGLAAVGCLTALAIWFEASAVERDLQKRTSIALRQNHAWAQVSLKGRDLTLTGIAPDEASQIKALDISRQIYGVRVAKDNSTLLPEEKPYRLTIEKTADGVILSGFVPNESARANITTVITGMLPGIAISDQMKLARGAPANLVDMAGYGLAVFPRLSTGALDITDRTMSISGQALDPEDHEIALQAVASIPDSAGTVTAVDIKPAAASGDYSWSASIGPSGVMLDGYVPDQATRDTILAQANANARDLTVENRMRFASGVPAGVDWQAAAVDGLSILEDLAEGTATVQGNVLNLNGQAIDADAFRRIQNTLSAGLSNGLVLGTADIGVANAPHFEWMATRSGDAVSFAGSLPSEKVRSRLLEIAGLKFGKLQVNDAQEIASGAPDGFEAAVQTSLQVLSRLNDAEIRIVDGTVFIQGIVLNDVASHDVERLLADGLPEGFTAEQRVEVAAVPDSVLPASDCQEELNRLAATNTVLFETAEAAIQDHSFGFLDRIAFTARQCGEVRLEITGHTDSDGSEADNLALSERRAAAVLDFMIAAGVSADRLVAIGYGESRPLENNETDAGKAANRRIEFRVLD